MNVKFHGQSLGKFVLIATAVVGISSCKARNYNQSGVRSSEGESTIIPTPTLSPAENAALWGQYCNGSAEDVSQTVTPNYEHDDVIAAVKVLNSIDKRSFYFYGDLLAAHKTGLPADPNIKAETHNFLSYLCGEFRDRATMIRAKLKWVAGTNYLKSATPSAFDVTQSPWRQMVLEDYRKYVNISRAYFNAKMQELTTDETKIVSVDDGDDVYNNTRYITIGDIKTIDRPIPALTVCKVKYMFSEYMRKNKSFDDLATFRTGYKAFKPSCPADDLNWYYDFRGDSNFKPNSPESNGMIWFAKSVAKQCQTRSKAKPNALMSDADCRRYFETPFASRFNAARAGLGAWLLRSPEHDQFASNSRSQVTVIPLAANNTSYHFGDKGPFQFRLSDKFVLPPSAGIKPAES